MYNFITNIKDCLNIASSMVWGNISIVYYSHVPVILVLLIVGILVLVKSKDIAAKILFILNMALASWVLADLITWVSSNSVVIMFFWSILGILEGIFFLASFYFAYTFIFKKYPPTWLSIISGAVFLPIILMTPTNYNLSAFDFTQCTAVDNYFMQYIFVFEAFMSALIILVSFVGYFKAHKDNKKSVILFILGMVAYLALYFYSGYMINLLGQYEFQIYGYVGMVIFSVFLTYLITKFKAFDIKVIATQILVWALVILIGSEFLFAQNITITVLIAITLVFSGILGLIIVSSVKKEVVLREQLEIANDGQKNLIHIMNHQIKGYLSIDKNIFAELLTNDYGEIPATSVEIISKGLESADKGTKYVTDILRGTSAEDGTLVYDMKEINFKEIVEVGIENLKSYIKKKKLKLIVEILDGDYMMIGDKVQLGEAVRNLIENSLYYTIKGSISVALEQKDNKILFSVKDTGVGIEDEDKYRIFKTGGITKNSIKVNVNSSGYGLVFVKGVVEKHKGRVWFESEGNNKGSTFFMELPIK